MIEKSRETEEFENFEELEKDYKEKVIVAKKELKNYKNDLRRLYCSKQKFKLLCFSFKKKVKEYKKIIILNLEGIIQEVTAKLFFGITMTLLGATKVLFPDSTDKSDVVGPYLDVVLGTLVIVLGIGLVILNNCEKNDEDGDSINVFIGKQLFEKGLYGLVIGVVVGSLTLLIEIAKAGN